MTNTLEDLVKSALSEYDFQDNLDEFFASDIDWVRDHFSPLIKKSLEKLLKEHGKEMLKDCLQEIVNEQVSDVDVSDALKEVILENLKMEQIMKRILK